MSDAKSTRVKSELNRRHFVTSSALVTALTAHAGVTQTAQAMGAPVNAARGKASSAQAPFDSLRDYLKAMEDYGLLARFKDVDQDAYEATAIMYKLQDQFGLYGLPVTFFENIKIDGEWIKGPIAGNVQSHYHQEALIWGLEPDFDNPPNSYRRARAYLTQMLDDNDGDFPQISAVTISRENAPCKEIVLEGGRH